MRISGGIKQNLNCQVFRVIETRLYYDIFNKLYNIKCMKMKYNIFYCHLHTHFFFTMF